MTPTDEPLELPLPSPPPPSERLQQAIRGMRPVGTRHPLRALAAVAVASLAWMAAWLALVPPRLDLPFLPRPWWIVVALAWLAGFLLPLGFALVPRRGAVLPDSARASRVATAVALGLVVVAVLLTPAAPGHTLAATGAPDCARWATHCLARALLFASLPLALALLALRRLLLVGSARLVAAAGAAGGALGGLTLHVICPMGGALHVGCGHAGAVIVAGLVGAGVGFLVERTRS